MNLIYNFWIQICDFSKPLTSKAEGSFSTPPRRDRIAEGGTQLLAIKVPRNYQRAALFFLSMIGEGFFEGPFF